MNITWSTLAKQQLKDIGQYVADNFGERTANKSLERIVKKVNGLYVFPESGSFDKKYSTDSYTVRHLTIHPNVVYYIQFANQITLKSATYRVSWEFTCKTTKILLLYIFLGHNRNVVNTKFPYPIKRLEVIRGLTRKAWPLTKVCLEQVGISIVV